MVNNMATFEGFELISNFSGVFSFLLTFSIVYGVLSVTNVFKENGKTLNPILAFSISLLASLSSVYINMVSTMAPWLIILVVGVFFVMLFLRFLGVSDDMFTGFFSGSAKEKKTVIYWVIIAVIIIVTVSVSIEIGDEVGPYVGERSSNVTDESPADVPTGSGNAFADNLGATLFHPKVVGAFLILLIASLAVRQLSQTD